MRWAPLDNIGTFLPIGSLVTYVYGGGAGHPVAIEDPADAREHAEASAHSLSRPGSWASDVSAGLQDGDAFGQVEKPPPGHGAPGARHSDVNPAEQMLAACEAEELADPIGYRHGPGPPDDAVLVGMEQEHYAVRHGAGGGQLFPFRALMPSAG